MMRRWILVSGGSDPARRKAGRNRCPPGWSRPRVSSNAVASKWGSPALPINPCDLIGSGLARDARIVKGRLYGGRRIVGVDEIGIRVARPCEARACSGIFSGDIPPGIGNGHAVGDIAEFVDAQGDGVADTRVRGVALVVGAQALGGGGEIDCVVIVIVGLECIDLVAGLGDGVRVIGPVRIIPSVDFGAQQRAPQRAIGLVGRIPDTVTAVRLFKRRRVEMECRGVVRVIFSTVLFGQVAMIQLPGLIEIDAGMEPTSGLYRRDMEAFLLVVEFHVVAVQAGGAEVVEGLAVELVHPAKAAKFTLTAVVIAVVVL